jgi:hypothetical protein
MLSDTELKDLLAQKTETRNLTAFETTRWNLLA